MRAAVAWWTWTSRRIERSRRATRSRRTTRRKIQRQRDRSRVPTPHPNGDRRTSVSASPWACASAWPSVPRRTTSPCGSPWGSSPGSCSPRSSPEPRRTIDPRGASPSLVLASRIGRKRDTRPGGTWDIPQQDVRHRRTESRTRPAGSGTRPGRTPPGGKRDITQQDTAGRDVGHPPARRATPPDRKSETTPREVSRGPAGIRTRPGRTWNTAWRMAGTPGGNLKATTSTAHESASNAGPGNRAMVGVVSGG